MDPENPVVKFCAEGMVSETKEAYGSAKDSFEKAWKIAKDDYEKAIAAHYVARHAETDAEVLRWNLLAFEHASLAPQERVKGFYPSLYLNLGHSYEVLGDPASAKNYYGKAVASLNVLSEDAYGEIVRDALKRGLERVASDTQ